ncbi:hypothetical protein Glove_271g104 [Diversispora epigaea]|uniref:Protein kinase domain-containing protein n=1 Tax=Diversispora epigaea TaxID=1348612 RepID=A0A397I6B9_9GLOM|nr:hypothetical protein Glove_271g104 [Diversispora epigaea]
MKRVKSGGGGRNEIILYLPSIIIKIISSTLPILPHSKWIPYDRFKDVKQIGRGGFGTIHYARRIDGPIDEWGILKIKMKLSRSGIKKMSFHLKTYIRSYNILIRFYGITQEPEIHSYMMVLYYATDGNLREYLKINFNNFNWEQKLDSLCIHFKEIYYSKLVGLINNCNNNFKNNHWSVIIEWIPYDRFKDVKQIGRGGFGTIHYARRIDGPIDEWGILKIKMKSYNILIRFYGITQEPEIHSYMMVLYYATDGNLREYLKINFNNFNWEQKLDSLCKLMEENPNNTEKKNIFGVFPYIVPEVLSGEKEYTKAADVYSFGFIFYEIVTGFPPYPDIPHYKDLAMKI